MILVSNSRVQGHNFIYPQSLRMSMSSFKPLEADTIEVLKQNEPKYIKALEIYYSRFETGNSCTFSWAAHAAGANTAFLVDYIFYFNQAVKMELQARGELTDRIDPFIGMPETREDALRYLNNLLAYKAPKNP